MRAHQIIKILLLSSVIAAPAAAFETKPGEWEMEVISSISGAPATKQKICISDEQAKNRYKAESDANRNIPENCKANFTGNNTDSFSYEVFCDEKGSKVETKGATKEVSDNEGITTTTMTIDADGRKQTQQVTVTQKFISDTCSKEAMKLPDGK
jgi:hypothetical protein